MMVWGHIAAMGLSGFVEHHSDRRQNRDVLQATASATLGDVCMAIEGSPKLRNKPANTPMSGVLESLIDAYRRHGAGFLDQIEGGFALAVIDRRSSLVLLAIDRMGIERLCYTVNQDGISFSTSVKSFVNSPHVVTRLRPQALFDYLLLHMVPSPGTVYENVHKLIPGTYVVFENRLPRVSRYWQPTFSERGAVSNKELQAELRSSLLSAVGACSPDERTGAFLSGGLDSSTVAGMLRKSVGRAVPTFSIGFGVHDYDELRYARIANRHFDCDPHEYEVVPEDIVDAFPKIAAAFDEPFGNSSAVPTYFCALLAAKHGVTHLLAGDGGDEIFGGNERYARHQMFNIYNRVPMWIRSRLLQPLVGLIDQEHGVAPLRKLRSYVDQARVPMPERLESWNFVYRTDLHAMLDPDFHAQIDTRSPIRSMSKTFNVPQDCSLLNSMLFFDWKYTLADNDLRKVGTMCRLAGVQVSYPMLDQRVIDLSIRVPSRQKMRRFKLRSFFKDAMAGFLPQEILTKSKHGFGLPFGVWLKTHEPLSDLIYSYLTALKLRGVVRPQFIDRLIDDHRTGHASYFGYVIWDLAMLEAWLQAHGADL